MDVPQVRDSEEPFRLALWEALRRRTDVLDRLAVEMYARGLSTRDIEDALKEATGAEVVLSRSSVSRTTEDLWEDFEAFAQRDLSRLDVVYLFLYAIYESLREQADLKEGILVSWGILSDGSKVLIHLSLGSKESYIPLTVTTDGAPGLIKAVEAIWPVTPTAPIIVNVRSDETYTLGYRPAGRSKPRAVESSGPAVHNNARAVESNGPAGRNSGRKDSFGVGAVEWVLFGPAAGWPADDVIFVAVNHPKTGPLGDNYAVYLGP